MQRIGLYIFMGIIGMILSTIAGFVPYPGNMLMGMFGGVVSLMAILQILGVIRSKHFLGIFKDLDKDEKFVFIPDLNNRLYLMIMKTNQRGVLFHKDLGVIADKGTTFSFGKEKIGFVLPESGFTVDLVSEQYFSFWGKKDESLESWDDFVQRYLNNTDYQTFRQRFRQPTMEPDAYKIQEELDFLINVSVPRNEMTVKIAGETVDFRSRCKFLKYNYDPVAVETSIDAEKVAVWKKFTNYKEKDEYGRWGAIAKAVAVIFIAFGVLMAILSSLDLSGFMGMFGGG